MEEDKPKEGPRLTLRVSAELYERIERAARGTKKRPASKINPTVLWLLERALDELEAEPGQFRPALLRAA